MSMDGATRSRLLGLFVTEAEESLALLAKHGSTLADPAGSEGRSEFGRVAHGLKGAAAALGLEALAQVLHRLEEVALGLAGAVPEAADERSRRVGRVLELLSLGIARMAASGADRFPEELIPSLQATLGGQATVAAPPRLPAPQERALDAGEEHLSVPASEVDHALRLASSVARSASLLQERLAGSDGILAAPVGALASQAQALEALVASLRLVPAETALSGLAEEVERLAGQLGKRVVLAVRGREMRADRRTIQAARGMIRHLVRNALDHGIESPEVRSAAGKPGAGQLTVSVRAGESALSVEVEDDGAGFDVPAIRAELARRRADDQRIASLSDEEVLQRFATEGGSTRAEASEISGRGLGLSAVASMARAAGGAIQVSSRPGLGCTVGFELPLSVYAVDVLAVHAGGRLLGIPLAAIDRTVHLDAAAAAIHDGPAGRTLAIDEAILPLTRLAEALGGSAVGAAAADRFALVVRSEGTKGAIAVDDLGAAIGIVPSPLPFASQGEDLVSGLARFVDGSVLQVLSARVLLERCRALRSRAPHPPAAEPVRGPLEVVLAEDSISTREVLRVLLEGQGFRVRVASDGEEALARVEERPPDVLVTDLNMPRRDGLALTRELRRRGATAKLPIVVLTSQDDAQTRSAGAEAGADAYLVKSRFNGDVLLETLARIGLRPRQ